MVDLEDCPFCGEHDLKIHTKFFQAIEEGKKNFEIRINDRDYKVGDIVKLREYNMDHYTGREVTRKITYITNFMQQNNYIVFGMEK